MVFFAAPDTLSGLYNLTNYVLESLTAVEVPVGSGCGAILTYPLREAEKEKPHAILGMFDVSARPMVESQILPLATPHAAFLRNC